MNIYLPSNSLRAQKRPRTVDIHNSAPLIRGHIYGMLASHHTGKANEHVDRRYLSFCVFDCVGDAFFVPHINDYTYNGCVWELRSQVIY